MRRLLYISIAVAALAILAGLFHAEGFASSGPPLAAKDLMLSTLSALRRDVAHDRWETAGPRASQLNSYWLSYRKSHPPLKKSVADNFAKTFRNLQTHLHQRSEAKVYVDLSALRAIVIVLKP